MEQDENDDIFLYLKETKYVDGKNNDKRILRGKAKNFVLGSHDNLYYIKDSRKKQVVTNEILISVLRLCHVDCGSHLGRDKTYHKVKKGPATLMFTAGYLMKELVIYHEEGVNDYLCACPCAERVEVQHIYHDKGDNFYPLSHKDLWRADGPSTRSKIIDNYQTLEEDNKGCLPGMESDSVQEFKK